MDSRGSQECKSTAHSDLDVMLTPVCLLSVPPALLSHDTTEEEGAGPRGGLQQSGVTRPRRQERLSEKEPIKTKRSSQKWPG